MLQNVLHRTCLFALNTVQSIIVRQNHIFDRTLLKPKVRCHFPKPREVKRTNVHGLDKRLPTTEGRRVLMRRMLKGVHNLSH
ncbi:large ribosomal subunit protein bL34m isoform X2 [Drosophila tropicalis]|uniref:large ribosomal subunit protein bL34m isoform X2 n=1 Tax=Drosophila tropicalis TaxID=46794 RepID=UPI0035AB7AE0